MTTDARRNHVSVLHAAVTALSIALLACMPVFGAAATTEDGQAVYGKGVSVGETVSIGELMAHPDRYVDTIVRVEGVITDVCPKAGCWMDIAGEDDARTVRIKVEDGEIVFPVEATGKHAVAEGRFVKIEMSREDAIAWARHLAEEKGEPFDPETATVATRIYRIEGTGAIIDER